ncbi:hypothetical protein B0H16DRAFT_1503636 [Mycena metata]|uniref:Uncharacterized protein n=1 Tax=Mycena metata TaxID=1033252 RepID=A0AAD7K7M9_9AGAR|nr:hypothetical protein B0H16DRAFT_1503636 [Mycena metata]
MLEQAEFHGGELDSAMYPTLRDSGDKRLRARLNMATDFDLDPTPDSPNSLFDEDLPASPIPSEGGDMEPASLCAPPIPGLFFTAITEFCLKHYFNRPGVNQIMLFGAASDSTPWSGLPPLLLELLAAMSVLLQPSLPPEIHALLFPRTPTHARQAILNLYHPGEGIIPHYGTVRPKQLFLPERTMIRTTDLVADADTFRIVERGVRLSITFRWLLASEDVVGLEA